MAEGTAQGRFSCGVAETRRPIRSADEDAADSLEGEEVSEGDGEAAAPYRLYMGRCGDPLLSRRDRGKSVPVSRGSWSDLGESTLRAGQRTARAVAIELSSQVRCRDRWS